MPKLCLTQHGINKKEKDSAFHKFTMIKNIKCTRNVTTLNNRMEGDMMHRKTAVRFQDV